jgi:hypothetical protein
MVPEELNISLDEALEKGDELKKTYATDGEVREVIDLARRIEGLARNVGTHAAAVVIADRPLTEYVPLGRVTGKTDVITEGDLYFSRSALPDGSTVAAVLISPDFPGGAGVVEARRAELSLSGISLRLGLRIGL